MKRFSIVNNGYNIEEVNSFIDVVINSVEGDVTATGKVIAGNVDGNVLSAAAVKVAEDDVTFSRLTNIGPTADPP